MDVVVVGVVDVGGCVYCVIVVVCWCWVRFGCVVVLID